MRLNIVYDARGEIVSANTLLPVSCLSHAPHHGVAVPAGFAADEIDVPAEYATWGLAEIARKLRVETGSGTRTLVPRG